MPKQEAAEKKLKYKIDMNGDSRGSGIGNSSSCTRKQLELVQHTNDACDFYHMLNLPRNAGEAEIRHAYRKIALKLHPDKNHAPGATDAFKLLGQAMETLTDEAKRVEYNYSLMGRCNEESDDSSDCSSSDSKFESYILSDDEVRSFDNFIPDFFQEDSSWEGANVVKSHISREIGASSAEPSPEGPIREPSLVLGVVLLVIFIAVCPLVFTSGPHYSFVQTSTYPILRETANLEVPYYVQRSFRSDNHDALENFENAIEADYFYMHEKECILERNHREELIAKARTSNQLELAKNLYMPSCEKLVKTNVPSYRHLLKL